jgi:hypothetical protein
MLNFLLIPALGSTMLNPPHILQNWLCGVREGYNDLRFGYPLKP